MYKEKDIFCLSASERIEDMNHYIDKGKLIKFNEFVVNLYIVDANAPQFFLFVFVKNELFIWDYLVDIGLIEYITDIVKVVPLHVFKLVLVVYLIHGAFLDIMVHM